MWYFIFGLLFRRNACAGIRHCVEAFTFLHLSVMAGLSVGVYLAFGEVVGAASSGDENAPAEPGCLGEQRSGNGGEAVEGTMLI